MRPMTNTRKVLTLDAKSVKEAIVALPFTTDAEIVAAWKWLVGDGRLRDFSYRPSSEGEDPWRSRVESYLAAPAGQRPGLDAATVKAMLGSLFGADLYFNIRDVISVLDYEHPAQPAMQIIDMVDSPGFNPATNQSRGQWSLRDVSSAQVTLDPAANKPRCMDHGAMNCVNAERTIWRCLACGRSCYDVGKHTPGA